MKILVAVDIEAIRGALTDADEVDYLEFDIDLPEDREEGRKELKRRISDYYAVLARAFAVSTGMTIFPKDEVQDSMRFFMGYPPFVKKEDIEETYMSAGELINAKELASGYADTFQDGELSDETPRLFEVWAEEVINEVRRT